MKVKNLFQVKLGTFPRKPQKNLSSHVKPNNECELCGGNHKAEQCPHERKFSWEWIPLVLTQKKNSLMVRVKV